MKAEERLEEFFGRVESVLDGRVGRFGPFLIVTGGYFSREMLNAIDLGRDHGRSEAGLPPTPVAPRAKRPAVSKIQGDCKHILDRAPVVTTRQKIKESADQHLLLGVRCAQQGVTLDHLKPARVTELRAVE